MKICELCGNEHDGSYGSGRFCSEHCRKSFCGKLKKNHKCNFPGKLQAEFGKWTCKYCGKICKTKALLYEHLHKKHKNQMFGLHGKGQTAWNKGLTKETDVRLKQSGNKASLSLKKLHANGYDNPNSPFCKSYWTTDRRTELSNQKIQFYNEHPDKHPNIKMALHGFISNLEKIAKEWLIEHNIDFILLYRLNLDGLVRYVDFYIPNLQLLLEVDGNYWHKDIKDIDAHKDLLAAKYNFKTLRVSDLYDIRQLLFSYFMESLSSPVTTPHC